MMKIIKTSLFFCVRLGFFASVAAIVLASGVWLYFNASLPEVSQLRDISWQTPLRVYTHDGKSMGEFGEHRRIPVSYDELPENLINAFLAAEDQRFLTHTGVDFAGLMRAVIDFLRSGRFKSGGSTITMQVARNYFLSSERTIPRKLQEILLAIRMEQELDKREIMELYINKIYLGKRAYGVAAAAWVYYGRPLHELSLAQLAMIAGLPKAPSAYNPVANPSRALTRRNWILDRMLGLDFINLDDWRWATAEPVTARYHRTPIEVEGDYVAEMARIEMLKRYGGKAYTEGYSVFTTVRSDQQRVAKASLEKGLIDYSWRHGWRGPWRSFVRSATDTVVVDLADAQDWQLRLRRLSHAGGLHPAAVVEVAERSFVAMLESGERIDIGWDQGLSEARAYVSENHRGPYPTNAAAVVAIGDVVHLQKRDDGWLLRQTPRVEGSIAALNPITGAITALVGGFDFSANKYNRVTQSRRQPGSSIKPFIYAAALGNGFSAAHIFNDAPIIIEDRLLEDVWRPANYLDKFRGPVRLRQALYESLNLVSVRLLRAMGFGKTIKNLKSFGFKDENFPRNLSLALGSHAMRSLDLLSGYAIFANGGYHVTPYLIDRVVDREGRVIFRGQKNRAPTICSVEEKGEEACAAAAISTDSASIAEAPRVMDERVVYIMNSMLRDVVRRGTGRQAWKVFRRDDLAGKTGTTNGPTDTWFFGYNQQLVAGVWVGFDQNKPMGKFETGARAALPIWIDFMRPALGSMPEHVRSQPDGLLVARIDPETGELAKPGQDNAQFELFLRETAPKGAVAPGAWVPPDNNEQPSEDNEETKALNELF